MHYDDSPASDATDGDRKTAASPAILSRRVALAGAAAFTGLAGSKNAVDIKHTGDDESFMFLWDDGIAGEDCLRVNVWTPGLDAAKRPVMVWLHGGGFVAGSGQELRAYDGENLARRGDVVVVSLNHRLGALGFLDLSQSCSAQVV